MVNLQTVLCFIDKNITKLPCDFEFPARVTDRKGYVSMMRNEKRIKKIECLTL